MASEQDARAQIDRLLTAAGWRVQDAKAANLHPEVIAQEMIEDLEAALEQLRAIAADLNGPRRPNGEI
jgi:hypothetical protein